MSSIEEMLSEDGELATFLRTQKERFFKDVRSGRGKKWTVVVGNRAGGELTLLDNWHDGLTAPQTSTLSHVRIPCHTCHIWTATLMWFLSA